MKNNIIPSFPGTRPSTCLSPLVAITLLFLMSCTPKDYEQLKQENAVLKTEIEELKNGAERTVALINKSLKEKSLREALELINKLEKHHPHNPSLPDLLLKKDALIKLIAEEDQIAKKKEQEALQRANQDNLGEWLVRNYVDDFGNPTKQKYITEAESLYGVFSNSATQDSKLRIHLLISSATEMDVMLYEYDGRNPVKAYSHDKYDILVQTKGGDKIKLSGKMWPNSDRIQIDKSSSKKLHAIFMQGGKVDFRIKKANALDSYSFMLQNADWYQNAARKLSEKD